MRKLIVMLAVLCFTAALSVAQQSAGLDERGIRLAKQPGNVRYDIELTRGTQHAIVQPDFQFQSGDRFTLRVRVAADSYVYVLNRTFVGAPDELRSSRQVRLVPNPASDSVPPGVQSPDADRPAPPYTLVYPQSGSRRLKAGLVNLIPGSQLALEMDENPGVEHLVLVVSPEPLDLGTMFTSTGELKTPPGPGQAPQRDTSADVREKLRRELEQLARNAEFEEAPSRSIEFYPIPSATPVASLNPPRPATNPGTPPKEATSPDRTAKQDAKQNPKVAFPVSVGAPKAPKQPYLVEIVLAHNPS